MDPSSAEGAIRRETRSIADFIADTIYRKQRVAQARFTGSAAGLEKPRDVYLAACASIGAHLEESYGFTYATSGPRSRKRSGDFTFQISFQSSHHNIAGEHIALWIHGIVLSAKMKRWRKDQGFPAPSDLVAGGQIGHFQGNPCWLEWDLADTQKRDQTIRDAIKAIEDLAFPFFARFENLPAMFPILLEQDMPGMMIDHAVEFLMCFADPPKARLAAANFLQRHADHVPVYQRRYQELSEQGLGAKNPAGFAGDLAMASHVFKFGDVTEPGA